MKRALLAGATGLVGSQLLQLLLKDQHYSLVKAITRKPLGLSHPKLQNIVVDFEYLNDPFINLESDDVFCCLGTTIRQAGTKDAFRKVDYDYPLAVAKASKKLGASQYLIVSALGANEKSSIFYNRVKGEVERDIVAVGFDTIHIFQPSLLLGNRNEHRPGEEAAKVFYKIFGRFFPGKYKAIDSARVARAMLECAKESKLGTYIHDSGALQPYPLN